MAKAMDPHMLRAIGGMRGIEDMMKQMQQGGAMPGGMGMQGLDQMMKKKGGKKWDVHLLATIFLYISFKKTSVFNNSDKMYYFILLKDVTKSQYITRIVQDCIWNEILHFQSMESLYHQTNSLLEQTDLRWE